MTVRAELTEREDIAIFSEFRDKDLIKTIPGARWDAAEKIWRVGLTWSACKMMRGVFGERLEIGDKLKAWAYLRRAIVDEGLALRLAQDSPTYGEFEPRLHTFQRGGVAFMVHNRKCLLADEMGTGKTIQTITALRYLWDVAAPKKDGSVSLTGPILIISPNTMKRTWKREFASWWPELRVVILTGSTAQRNRIIVDQDYDVLVVNWEQLRLHSRLAPFGSIKMNDKDKEDKELNEVTWGAVVADEAHKLKNPQAQQTRAAWWVARQCPIRFALTGTPIGNAPHDLWSILHWIDEKEWPSKTRYQDRYCLLSWNAFGGLDVIGLRPDTMEEFQAVVDPIMRRMPKDLVLPFLPPRTNESRFVEMTAKQAKAYHQMETNMFTRLENGDTIITTNPIAQLTRLMQFASAYAEVVDDNVKLTAPSCKVDALLDILDEAGEESVVVFAMSRQLIMLAGEALEKANISHGYITGGQSEAERDTHIERFQEGKIRVILCTIAAGGVGVTLTKARICVFLQRSFSLIDNVQAEARIHRIGSEHHNNVLIIDVLSEGTVDERAHEIIVTKGERLEEVVRDRETLRKLLGGGEPKKGRKKKDG